MSTENDVPALLADGLALTINGPTIIFVRPRRQLSDAEEKNAGRWGVVVGHELTRRHGVSVFFQIIPHDFDIMVAGEAELKQVGLMRIPQSPASPEHSAKGRP